MFPSRYFTQRYYASAFWPKVGEDAETFPTPSIWYIETRNRNWDIELSTEYSLEERTKVWTITDDVSASSSELSFSWDLPSRTKEWVL